MNFEGLEQFRYENTQSVMAALTAIVNDNTVDVKERIHAAKVVDAMSDSIIKAYLMTKHVDSADSTNKKLLNQLDRLTDKEQ